MLYNLYPWEKTDNIVVLTTRMKQPIDFPPHIKVSPWLKQLIVEMMTIDEYKRINMKQVLEILNKNSEGMDI
jgi:ribosomal protein S10